MKVALEKVRGLSGGAIPWIACEPFVENKMAVLVHRVRSVTTYKIGERWKAHIAVGCWCGNHMAGTHKFTFLAAPKDDAIVCARCESAAVKEGMPASESLAGRHVHIGGVKAFRTCCEADK